MTAEEKAWVERVFTRLQERIDELEGTVQEQSSRLDRLDELKDEVRQVRNRVYRLEQG